MFKKFLLACILAFPLFAMAGPEQMERHDFCGAVAENSAQAAAARTLGMEKKEFDTKMDEYAVLLLSKQVPVNLVQEMVFYMKEAYAAGHGTASTMEAIYKACMNKKVT
jgi:hypothetical protein